MILTTKSFIPLMPNFPFWTPMPVTNSDPPPPFHPVEYPTHGTVDTILNLLLPFTYRNMINPCTINIIWKSHKTYIYIAPVPNGLGPMLTSSVATKMPPHQHWAAASAKMVPSGESARPLTSWDRPRWHQVKNNRIVNIPHPRLQSTKSHTYYKNLISFRFL